MHNAYIIQKKENLYFHNICVYYVGPGYCILLESRYGFHGTGFEPY
jgi:hypothetical protein